MRFIFEIDAHDYEIDSFTLISHEKEMLVFLDGEHFTQKLSSEGEFRSSCTVHVTERIHKHLQSHV